MKQFKTNHGFALMEVVLASGIAAIISFAMLQLMSTTIDTSVTVEDKVNKLIAEELLLQNFITQPAACMKTFEATTPALGVEVPVPVPPKSYSLTELLDIRGEQIINTGSAAKKTGILVDSITIKDVKPLTSPSNAVVGQLEIKYVNKGKLVLKPSYYSMYVTYDAADPNPTKKITSCGISVPGENKGLSNNFCYAILGDRFEAPRCYEGYYLKALLKSTNHNWDGYGAVCCHSNTHGFATDSQGRAMITDPKAFDYHPDVVVKSRGWTYNQIAKDCHDNKASYFRDHISESFCPVDEDNDPNGSRAVLIEAEKVETLKSSIANKVFSKFRQKLEDDFRAAAAKKAAEAVKCNPNCSLPPDFKALTVKEFWDSSAKVNLNSAFNNVISTLPQNLKQINLPSWPNCDTVDELCNVALSETTAGLFIGKSGTPSTKGLVETALENKLGIPLKSSDLNALEKELN